MLKAKSRKHKAPVFFCLKSQISNLKSHLQMNILTLLIFTPLLFGLLIILLPSAWRASFKYITLLATLVQLGISIWMYLHFKTGVQFAGINNESGFQFMQKLPWINLDLGTLGKMQIDYFVGIDGISITLVVMR